MDAMNDAALERDIERALAVDPSPEFVARVRTRIAEEPPLSSRRLGFAGIAATAVAAAGAIAIYVASAARPIAPANGPLLASRPIASPIVVPALGHVGADQHVRPGSRSRVGPTHRSAPTMSAALATTFEPATLFDTRETMTLQRLIAAVRDARVDLTPLLRDAPMALQSLDNLVIPPITIEPLVPSGVEGERP